MTATMHQWLLAIGAATGAVALTATGAAAQSKTNAQLAAQVGALTARVDDLESNSGSGGFEIAPGTILTIYGDAKADLLFDLDYDLGNTIFGFSTIDSATPRDSSAFTAHAFQTRLGFTTETDTGAGILMTKVEGDFFGSGGGQFRLRHAYGEFKGVLAGQTWTNFMPIESYPSTLDFQGPSGIPFTRQTQVRYTFSPGDSSGLKASFSVENDPSSASDRAALTAAASYSFGNSFVKLAAVSRSLNGASGSQDAYGVNLSGHSSLWQGGTLQASFTTGEGISSYMVYGGTDLDAAGDTLTSTGVTLGVSQEITKKVTLGLVYGLRDNSSGAGTLGTDTDRLETIHLNVMYHPVDNVMFGAEYINGDRQQFDGKSFSADRIQVSAQFNF